MLTLERVAVRYSGRPVLRDVSFSIGPGEIVAYLGANGAGKTTTMKVVTGLREPDYGRVLHAGRDVTEDPLGFRHRLGYVPETAEVYPFLSGREYLLLAGRLRELAEATLAERVDELLELLELGPHRHHSTHHLEVAERLCGRVLSLHQGRSRLSSQPWCDRTWAVHGLADNAWS